MAETVSHEGYSAPMPASPASSRNSMASVHHKPLSPTSPVYAKDIHEVEDTQRNPYPSPEHARPDWTTQGSAQQYQQRLPTFNGRVQSVQSLESRDLQTPSPDLALELEARRLSDPPIQAPLASPVFRSQTTHQAGPMPQPQRAIISSGESPRSSKSSSDFEGQLPGHESPISQISSGGEQVKLYPQLQYHQQLTENDNNYHERNDSGPLTSHNYPERNSSVPIIDNSYHERNGSGPLDSHNYPDRNSRVPHLGNNYRERNASGPLVSNSYQERNGSGLLVGNGAPQYRRRNSESPNSASGLGQSGGYLAAPGQYLTVTRPSSMYSTLSADGRVRSPGSPHSPHQRAVSAHSYDSRLSSYTDLTQPAHNQAPPPIASFDNSQLREQVGINASLLTNKQTLEMYRTNAKKSQDPRLQYELAVFMIQAAQLQDSSSSPRGSGGARDLESPYVNNAPPSASRNELLREARSILERLASKMAQAQYYLADAYASGLFSKGKEENEKAFPLFVAASKHGHAEAGYRAALCYEFGWGCRKDPAKAVQFYRQSASKSHPGAMTRLGMACLRSDLGIQGRYKEGVKWLKRATDVADAQYPTAPYELACMHETGFGDDVFQDPTYAAQLFTQAAELGHADAYYRMGDAYEHGKLNCPRDAALSVHFYTGAAQRGHAMAMMALCAWYLVGAEPVLEKNEDEAYQWALKASESGMCSFSIRFQTFKVAMLTGVCLYRTSQSGICCWLLH